MKIVISLLYSFLVNALDINFGFMYILHCTNLSVNDILMWDWSTNSNHSILGYLRYKAQTIH